MSKPHEEKWETGEGVLSGALYENGIWIGSFTDPKRARLAVHAPEMVRLLSEILAWDLSQRATPEAPLKSPFPDVIALLTKLEVAP